MTLLYHFIGIGGIGMSALARLLRHEGVPVSGSDRADSPILDDLRRLGASIHVGHGADNVPVEAIVVASDAIHEDNPEVIVARARGQKVMRRSELLGEMMAKKTGIAVSGTHGKTTTTAMVAHVLLENGLDPTVVVGGEALGAEGNAHPGTGAYFVAEACEAYGSFLHLSPTIAVVTNIEPDHLDHHGDFDNIRAAFRDFTARIRPGGVLIVNADDPECHDLAADYRGRSVTYGLREGNLRAGDQTIDGLGTRFSIHSGAELATVSLSVPGRHNVSNALAAFAVGMMVGLAPADIARALGTYRGVVRRFEYLGERSGVRVFDDYAHHPTEVKATLAAARTAFGNGGPGPAVLGRTIAVFQPHLFSRTRDFLTEFIAAFDDADIVVLTDIYKAREEPIPGVSSAAIVEGVRTRRPDTEVWYVPDKGDLPAILSGITRPGDTVITMGAGDIRKAGESFLAAGRLEVAA